MRLARLTRPKISAPSRLTAEDRARVAGMFKVYEERQEGSRLLFFGTPLTDDREKYYALWQYFNAKGLQMQAGVAHGENVLILSPPVREHVWVNVLLLVATFLSTTAVGSIFLYQVDAFAGVAEFLTGLPFSIGLMTVLGSHELGHYMVSRRWGVRSSLPYFIPLPLPPLGTLGALIRQHDPIPNRRALFDIGAAGPLVGVVIAIVVVVLGAAMGPYYPPGQPGGGMTDDQAIYLNGPPLFDALYNAVSPPLGEGYVHPVAFAGWVGLFLTMLNLLPVGQLDGGHVARAVLGARSHWLSLFVPPLLVGWGLIATMLLNQDGDIWLFWGILTLFFSGRPHPPPVNDDAPVGRGRMLVAVAMVLVFLACFPPLPFMLGPA